MPYEVKEFKRGTLIIVTEARLTSENAPGFGSVMEGQLQQGVKHLIIDLSHVQYFSSAAIREVITVLKHSRERGGDLRLCAPSEKVLEVLNLAGLTPIFTIYEDQVGAVGSL